MAETSYTIRELPWDTELFGIKMGEVLLNLDNHENTFTPDKLRNTLELARQHSYTFLLCQLDAHCQEITASLVSQGAKIGDTLVTLELNLKELPEGSVPAAATVVSEDTVGVSVLPKRQIIAACPGDLPVICHIAAESFSHSRIFQDTRFDPTKARHFYPKWIQDSFGTIERIYILKDITSNNNISGFISLQYHEDVRRIVIRLIAVDQNQRGSGYGQAMMDWLIREAITKGFQRIQVGTQTSNAAALHLYEKNGFRPIGTKHRFHIWLDQ